MLPLPAGSRSSSPILSSPPSLSLSNPSKLAINSLPAPLRPYALRLRALYRSRPLLTSLSSLLVLLSLVYFLLLRPASPSFSSGTTPAHSALAWGTHPDAILNYGDYIGLGHAREKTRASTPVPYSDISDKLPRFDRELSGPLYRKRRSREERDSGVEPQDLDEGGTEKKKKSKKATQAAEKERHGVLGGASTEWSTGIVGSGTYLGPVDMLKDSPASSHRFPHDDDPTATSPALHALQSHILVKGWVYLDEEDRVNTEKLQKEAREKDFLESLPLRERVREDQEGRKDAAEGWARIYAAEAGGWPKSALEVQLERMVRRAPVVVFSKTTCPWVNLSFSLLSHKVVLTLSLPSLSSLFRSFLLSPPPSFNRTVIPVGQSSSSRTSTCTQRLTSSNSTCGVRPLSFPALSFPSLSSPAFLLPLLLTPQTPANPHPSPLTRTADAATLKSLLTRRTAHSTFPNILVGGRSIGGREDLERAIEDGELRGMLGEVGVVLGG